MTTNRQPKSLVTKATAADIVNRLIRWQQRYGRHDMPWQQEPTPYKVLVSEVMLQQTQVNTVIPYYQRWLARFPSAQALAAASDDEVMQLWQGLGYYARARNLKKAALYINDTLANKIPNNPAELQKIPGVGPYTAGAITSFAFDQPGPIVDGNIKRLFCRYFGIVGLPSTSQVDKQLWQIAKELTPQQNNRVFAQALLDVGSMVCKPKQPRCSECPLADNCFAHKNDKVSELPTPKPKRKLPIKTGYFFWLQSSKGIYLERRPEQGIWGQLWCLPELSPDEITSDLANHGTFSHKFTHYQLEAKIVKSTRVNSNLNDKLNDSGRYFKWTELANVGLPKPIKSYLLKHQAELL